MLESASFIIHARSSRIIKLASLPWKRVYAPLNELAMVPKTSFMLLGYSKTHCTVSGTSRPSFQLIMPPKPVTAIGRPSRYQLARSTWWIPSSPRMPEEVCLDNLQLHSFSRSGVEGAARRHDCFLFH